MTRRHTEPRPAALLLTLLTALPATAQRTAATDMVRAEHLRPPTPHFLLTVDLGPFAELGILDSVERSIPGRLMLREFRRTFGFELLDVERIEASSTWREDGRRMTEPVLVFSGTSAVTLAGFDAEGAGWNVVQTPPGEPRAMEGFWGPDVLEIRPGMVAFAPLELRERLLGGEGLRAGVPPQELLALCAQQGLLAQAGFHFLEPTEDGRHAVDLLDWPFDDLFRGVAERPTGMRVQAWVDGVDHVHAEWRLRFEAPGEPTFELAERARNLLAQLRTTPSMARLGPVLEQVEVRAEGGDVYATVDLGTGRTLQRNLSRIIEQAALLSIFGMRVQPAVERFGGPDAPATERKGGGHTP